MIDPMSSNSNQNESNQTMSPSEASNELPIPSTPEELTEKLQSSPSPPTPPTPNLPTPPTLPPATPTASNADFNPPKRSKVGLWILIAVFFIVFAKAGLIYATEMGYLNLGLEKIYNAIGLERIWGGLPFDPQKALSMSEEKMKEVTSYHFTSMLNIKGALSEEDTSKITKALPQNGQGRVLAGTAESFSFNLNSAGDFEKPDKFSISISLSSNQSSSPLIEGLLPLSMPSVLSADIKSVDRKIYFKIPALSTLVGSQANKWVQIDLTQQQNAQNIDYFQKITQLSGLMKSGKRLAPDKILGKPVYHYQLTLDKGQFNTLFKKENISAISDPKIDYYIGRKDHLIYKISLDIKSYVQNSQIEMKGDVTLSDFNKKFKIEAPKKEEVFEKGLTELAEMLMGGGNKEANNTIEARDATRKKDLGIIKSALESYHKDNNSYPVSLSIDKTNNPNGVLAKALVPKYLSSLPVDPNDPTYWYGYTSDGKSFTLWSLLENTSDPEGKRDGNYVKYIVTND